MAEHKPEFDGRHVAIVAVSFVDPANLSAYQARHNWPFILASDPKRDAYHEFTLRRLPWWRVFSPATWVAYRRLIRRGFTRAAKTGDDIYQGGGDFLLDREGKILFAHRSREPADRPAVSRLLQAIDEAQSGNLKAEN